MEGGRDGRREGGRIGFLQAEPVGAYERADKGMDALPVAVSVVTRWKGGREGGKGRWIAIALQ